MGSDVEITHGGVVSVDPADLRAMAGRILADAAAVQVAREELLEIPGIVQRTGLAPQVTIGALSPVWTVANRLCAVGSVLDELSSSARTMADIFEYAELCAQQAMLDAGDIAPARDLRRRMEQLVAGDARLPLLYEALRQQWRDGVTEGFVPSDDAPLSPERLGGSFLLAVSPVLFLLDAVRGWNVKEWTAGAKNLMTSIAAEHGVVRVAPLEPTPGLVLRASPGSTPDPRIGAPGDIVLSRTEPVKIAAAPVGLSAAVSRVPYGQGPQVRVEKYEMGDGTPRFVAYIDGTRGQSEEEPWSFDSNVPMYQDHAEAASYKATMAALQDAGADSRTPVDLVGYSQGGMIAGLVAQSGEFDVQGVFTIGSPIEPVLPDDVLSVAVRHTDDPVAGLAGGGSPGGTGSDDSLVITRTVAPGHGIDPATPAHRLDGYTETVRLAEASGDSRLEAIREHFALLDGAEATVTDYTAKRWSAGG